MIEITPLAKENLTDFLTGRKLPLQVRVTCPCGGGDGDGLILVPDPPGPDDISADFDPLTLSMSRDLYERVGRVRVDFKDVGHDFGFIVESERPLGGDVLCEGCTDCV